MRGYKLSDERGQTHGGCQWGENVTHTAKGEGKMLCSKDLIHYYEDPLLAVFANPIHGDFDTATMQLWECEVETETVSDNLKSGCKTLTTIKQIPVPVITTEQRVKIAILCGKQVYKGTKWNTWADKWLDGSDQTAAAADAAAAAAAAYAAAYAADVNIIEIIHKVMEEIC